VTGTQPSQPTLACYQSATFNTNTCQWDVAGTQPSQPSIACYETATWNGNTCVWDVTGTQPSQPTLACYQSATFNTTTCQWDVTGTQPLKPTIACYEIAIWNANACQWDVTGVPNPPISTIDSACGSYTWNVNEETYYQSGTYSYYENCQDYILILNILSPTTYTNVTSACGSYTWSIDGATYTQSGSYTSVGSCSVDFLVLTILSGSQSVTTQTVCNSYVWANTGQTYTQSGMYTGTTVNCVTELLDLTVINSSNDTSVVSACGSYTWINTGQTYTQGGIFTGTTSNCVTQILNLTITNSTDSTISVSACNSYSWINTGLSYTQSGVYTGATSNCVTQLLDLTITNTLNTNEVVTACGSYTWQGATYTQAGNYTRSSITPEGCMLIQTLKLTMGTPSSSFSDTALCSVTSYLWNGTTYTTNGTYTYLTTNASGCDSTAVLRLVFSSTYITATSSAAVTQTLVANNCGARIYRFSAASVTNANSYAWTIPASYQGGAVSVDSGYTRYSQVIRLRFSSNAAAGLTDSIAVRPYNGCSSGAKKSYRLTNSALTVPAAPTITATIITANTCGARVIRYTGSAPKAATTTTGASTGYAWVLPTGRLGSTCVLDSGTLSGQIIKIRYTNNSSAFQDTVRLAYTSDCGNSAQVKSAVTLAALNPPAAPTITATVVVSNVCGARVVRYTGSAPKAATTTTGASTGYAWVLPTGRLGSTCVLDSGTLSGQVIRIRYTDNSSALQDTVRLAYTSNCDNSAQAKSAVTLTALGVPAAPTFTSTVVVSNVCGARIIRYTASAPKAATTTAGASNGYAWVLPTGAVGSTCVLDSGTLSSQVIRIRYVSNSAASLDTVRVAYTSDCGNSAQAKAAVVLTALAAPAAPASVTQTLLSDICYARTYRFAAPALIGATTSAGAATGWDWTFVGTLAGVGFTVDSGSLSSQVVRITFYSNAAAVTGDSAKVRYTSGCGFGAWRAQKLSNVARTGCPPPPNTARTDAVQPDDAKEEWLNASIFPNPTSNYFNLSVTSSMKNSIVQVRILDMQGREHQRESMMSGEVIKLGSGLKTGTYFVEVIRGRKAKVLRIVKL
jgi:hypothetical protein